MRPVSKIERSVAPFEVVSPYQPSGDQPAAIAELDRRIRAGEKDVVLLGATGTGKSATTAWMIEKLQRPTLVMAPIVRALVGRLHRPGELPRRVPPGAAPAVQHLVEAGQERAGQVVLRGGQLSPVRHRGRHGGRRAGADSPDQRFQVLAVDGRVVERTVRAVPVRVEPATARTYDGAPAARLADARQTELARPDAGVGGDLVEGVREHVESGGRRALVGGLEGVDLLQLTVRLDHHQVRGGEAEGLRQTGPAAQCGEDRGEQAHRHRGALLLPAVEDREEPVGVGRGRSVRAGRGLVPGGVRQKEVDGRGGEFGEGVHDRARVVLDVDGAQETEIEVAVALLPQQVDGLEDEGVAAASVGEAPVPVVGRTVAVEGDTHLDAELVEQVQVTGAELQAVGMDPQVEIGYARQGLAELFADAAQTGGAGEQGLPSVQDH